MRTKKISGAEARRILADRMHRGMLFSYPSSSPAGMLYGHPALCAGTAKPVEDAADVAAKRQRAAARLREVEIMRARLRT